MKGAFVAWAVFMGITLISNTLRGIIGLPSLITILGILYVLDRAEEIVRDLSFGIGAARDTGSAVSTANTALHTISNASRVYGTASRFLPIVLRGITSDGRVLVADPVSVERSNRSWVFRLY